MLPENNLSHSQQSDACPVWFAAFDEGVIDVINIDFRQTTNGKTHNRCIKHAVNCCWLYQSCGSTLYVVLTLFEVLTMSRKHQKTVPSAFMVYSELLLGKWFQPVAKW